MTVPERFHPRVARTLQRATGGAWLLVRVPATEHDPPATLRVYAANRAPLGGFPVGPSVSLVQATAGGLLWVSYTDQGVFDDDLSRGALNCFDLRGRRLFRFDEVAARHGLPEVYDCYWFNAASECETWAYYYNSFTLVRLTDLALDGSWRVPVPGAHAFAVADDAALFAGTYRQPSQLTLVSLRDLATEEVRLLDAEGHDLAFTRAYGRGPLLHFERDDSVFVADLRRL